MQDDRSEDSRDSEYLVLEAYAGHLANALDGLPDDSPWRRSFEIELRIVSAVVGLGPPRISVADLRAIPTASHQKIAALRRKHRRDES
jgi:hypothetical protein